MTRQAYIFGKSWVIKLGGIILFSLLVKGVLTLSAGLSPVALEFSGDDQAAVFPALPGSITHVGTFTAEIVNGGFGTVFNIDNEQALGTLWQIEVVNGNYIGLLADHFLGGFGSWNASYTEDIGVPVHIAITYDGTDTANDPEIYLNGVALTVTEGQAPAGDQREIDANKFVLGSKLSLGVEFGGISQHVRYYNRILSAAEVATIAADPGDPSLVTDGLVFQAPNVRTDRLADYIDQGLSEVYKVLDNVYQMPGVPLQGTPTIRAIQE